MIKIRLAISFYTLLTFLISCTSSQNDSKKSDLETTVQQKTDTIIVNPGVKKNKDDDKYPKVLTYTEIIVKNEELLKDYEDSKKYSKDTLASKIRMNQIFYNYLTTQLKYMQSNELRLLRNEFFARKGYKFKSDDLNDYFNEYYWYIAKNDDIDNIELSSFEKNIIDTIKVYEQANTELDEKSLKKAFVDYCKINLKKEYDGNYIDIPSILFRRNLGHKIENFSDHNQNLFNGEFLRIQIIDTLKNDNLLMGLFEQIMCPAEFCLWGGELITCDSSLNYLDSESIVFETIEQVVNGNEVTYRFGSPSSESFTLIKIDNDGKIKTD